MSTLLPIFKGVSLIFAVASVATGIQAILSPVGFSRSFGLPLSSIKNAATSTPLSTSRRPKPSISPAESYVALMGVRQLATGTTLLTFAYQQKWTEIATILSIIGIVVAGTDGFYLFRSGAKGQARFHAIPGAMIALLAAATIFTTPAMKKD